MFDHARGCTMPDLAPARRVPDRQSGCGLDIEPNVRGGVVAGEVNVPTAARRKAKPGAPLVTGPVVVASRMPLRPEHQRVLGPVRTHERDTQRAAAGHAPDDLQLLTNPWWNVTGSERKSPQLTVSARPMYLVRSATDAEP